MTVSTLQVVQFPPVGQLEPGRGFYQTEEDSLYVQVGNYRSNRHFFSYLESEHVRFDFDKGGRLLFIEVSLPRRRWQVVPDWHAPERAEQADIRWLDFRETISDPAILTNRDLSKLELRFRNRPAEHFLLVAESIILGVTSQQTVCSVWIADIEDDRAGREIAAFRRLTVTPETPAPSPAK